MLDSEEKIIIEFIEHLQNHGEEFEEWLREEEFDQKLCDEVDELVEGVLVNEDWRHFKKVW